VEIKVVGATAPDGVPYVRVGASRRHAWIARVDFTGSGAKALRRLNAEKISLLSREWAQCRKKVDELKSYPPRPLLVRPGRNGKYFALADGTVFPRSAREKPIVLFKANANKGAATGTIEDWIKITSLLERQPLATFVLLSACVAPFLALTDHTMNFGFELAGPPGVGKSTLQRLAAAFWGPVGNFSGDNFWTDANATANALERVMADYGDMLLVIEELNLYAAADHPSVRARKLRELVFKLANGTEKLRFGRDPVERSSFTFLTASNESLPDLLGTLGSPVRDAVTDRLMTIPIDGERPYKFLDCLPRGFQSSGDFARHLDDRLRDCHGVGIRHLLARLVVECAERPETLSRRLRHSVRYFCGKVRVDPNDGSALRVATAFGLVYAVAKLAILWGAVSKRLKPLEAAISCFELHRATRISRDDPLKTLRKLAEDWDRQTLDYAHLRQMSDQEVESSKCFLRRTRSQRFELLFTSEQFARAIPNRQAFLSDPRIQRILISEDQRLQTKRQIRSNRKAERMYCFRVPQEWIESGSVVP
jgi:hypothetical protein